MSRIVSCLSLCARLVSCPVQFAQIPASLLGFRQRINLMIVTILGLSLIMSIFASTKSVLLEHVLRISSVFNAPCPGFDTKCSTLGSRCISPGVTNAVSAFTEETLNRADFHSQINIDLIGAGFQFAIVLGAQEVLLPFLFLDTSPS